MVSLFSSPSFLTAKENRVVAVLENVDFPRVTKFDIFAGKEKSTTLSPLAEDESKAWVYHDADLVVEPLLCLQNTIALQSHLYYSSGNEVGFGRHRDLNDVLFVQLFGKTKWRVENPENGDLTESILDPYDAIYVPHGFFHTVTNESEERAGLSITVGDVTDVRRDYL